MVIADLISRCRTNLAITSGGFGYDADDRLTTDSYDANGNTIGSGGLTYSYDFENHLIQQGGATFVYDGDGNRVEKIAGGVTTSIWRAKSIRPAIRRWCMRRSRAGRARGN
jgi:hypothetical protein